MFDNLQSKLVFESFRSFILKDSSITEILRRIRHLRGRWSSCFGEIRSIVSTSVSETTVSYSGLFSTSIDESRSLPAECHWSEDENNEFDSIQWEQFLVKSFPRLKVFQLNMNFSFLWDKNHQEKFDRYFSTYRSSFWIDRRWFIRCHWGLGIRHLEIHLYSLPYAFNDSPILRHRLNFQIKSTCPDDWVFSYDSVREINYESWMFNDPVMSRVQLKNIENLSVEFPLDSRFLSIVPTFCNLHSLVIDKLSADSEFELQEILDRSPHLEELTFNSWTTLTMPLYRLESSSIHRLDLAGCDELDQPVFYTSEQCLELVHSPLGRQCRVLTIRVDAFKCLLILTIMMTNLQTLYLQTDDDDQPNADDFIKCLQELLSTKWRANRASFGAIRIQS